MELALRAASGQSLVSRQVHGQHKACLGPLQCFWAQALVAPRAVPCTPVDMAVSVYESEAMAANNGRAWESGSIANGSKSAPG